MPSIIKTKNGFRAFVRIKGTNSINASFATQEEAIKWARKEEHARKPITTAYTDAISLKQLWQIYLQTDGELKKPKTLSREKQNIKPILQLLGDYAIQNITPAIVQQYFDKRKKMPNKRGNYPAPDTLRLEKSLISTLYGTAILRGQATNNPARGVKFKLPKCVGRDKRITVEQQNAMLQEAERLIFKKGAGKRMNAAMLPFLGLLFATGMRPGEASKLKTEWMEKNIFKPRIIIPADETKNGIPRNLNIPRTILADIVAQWDRARLVKSPYLFWSIEPITGNFKPYNYHKGFSLICKNLGIDAVAHSVRHELVSRLFEETNLADSMIAAIIGHSNVASLANYKHIRSEAHRGALDEFQSKQLEKISKLGSGGEIGKLS